MWKYRLMAVSLGVAMVGLFVWLASMRAPGAKSSGQAAPDIELKLNPGAAPTKLSALQGKVVVLDFWATWCGPCRQSIPALEALYKKYGAQGLQVIGISKDDPGTEKEVASAVKELGITYPIVYGFDIPDLEEKYPSPAIPKLYILDKKGIIREEIEGYDPSGDLAFHIEPLLSE